MSARRSLRTAVRSFRRLRPLWIASLAVALLSGALAAKQAERRTEGGAGQPDAVARDEMRFVGVNGHRFDPLVQAPDIPVALRAVWPGAGVDGYYLLQFKDRVSMAMRGDVEAAGVALLHYIPHNAFIVRADGPALDRARQIDAVRWIGPFHPAYKLSRLLDVAEDAAVQRLLEMQLRGRDKNAVPRVDTRASIVVRIVPMEPSQVSAVADAVKTAGGRDVRAARGGPGAVRAEVPRTALERLAREPGVLWIDRDYPRFPMNDIARWVIQSNDSTTFTAPIHAHGLRGTGQLVTVGDTGIDYAHEMFFDPNMPIPPTSTPPPSQPQHRKVTAYYVPPNAGGDNTDNGPDDHGTHTSGTVAGDAGTWHLYDGLPDGSTATVGPHDGQAFDASIQVQDLSTDGTSISPPDIWDDLFEPAIAAGSFIHTNSWGACCPFRYHTFSAGLDDYTWRNKDILLVFSAGNFGDYIGGSANTINAEAIAKNVLAVGATANGTLAANIASFSSRGPVLNSGRMKPDVMAPGVGTWSSLGCIGMPDCLPNHYWQLSGTSMSAPAVAGGATLVRQYFYDGWYPSGTRQPAARLTPTAALLKAMMINSATEINGAHAYDSNETRYPNNQQGWGRILLDDVLAFRGDARGLYVHDNRTGVALDQTMTYEVMVDGSTPFEATLVWNDREATLPVTDGVPDLVNDLDLVVTSANRKTYRGNQYTGFNPGESLMGANTTDHTNNVEGVLVRTVTAGLWTVKVTGFNIPMGDNGRQPYALVITGGEVVGEAGSVQLNADRYPSTAAASVRVADVDLNLSTRARDTTIVSLSSTTEPTPQSITLTETGNSTAIFTGSIVLDNRATPIAGDGKLQVVDNDTLTAVYFDADDGRGGSGNVQVGATVDDSAPVITGVTAAPVTTRATITWSTSEAADSVVKYGTTRPPSLTASDTTRVVGHRVSLSGLTPATTYYYEVRSTDETGNTAVANNGGAFYQFDTHAAPGPNAEWPGFQNTPSREGRSSSLFLPPLQQRWKTGPVASATTTVPIVADGRLFVATADGIVRARDLATGAVIWQRQPSASFPPLGEMVVSGGVVYGLFCSGAGFCSVYALNAATGAVLWQSALSSLRGLAVGDQYVFTTLPDSNIYALRKTDGSIAWQKSANYVSWRDLMTVPGKLIVGSNSFLGDRTDAFNQTDGSLAWSQPVGGATLLYSGGVIYTSGTNTARLYKIDASLGTVLLTSSTVFSGTLLPPAFDGTSLYFTIGAIGGTDNSYYAINASNLSVRWRIAQSFTPFASPAYANGYLYMPEPSQLKVLSAATGGAADTRPLASSPTVGCAVSDGTVYVLDGSGAAYAFDGTRVDTDADGDPDDSDCAAADPAVHHGVVEACNGIDDNCVNGIDEGCAGGPCDGDLLCEAGEDCLTCPSDCPSGTSGGASCGNGACEAGNGEDCLTCPADCNGKQSGPSSGKYCCGDGTVPGAVNPVTCGDSRCTANGRTCTPDPVNPTSYCCGDSVCQAGETCSSCGLDCTVGAEVCTGGIDEDCNGMIDCADPACAASCGPVCGDHVCQTASGEDCLSCAVDCNGKQSGSNATKYCCSDGTVPGAVNPVTCADARCTANGNTCQ